MSVQAMAWVLEASGARLGPRLVLLSIANHARDDGSGAWPSVGTLALEANLSLAATHRALRSLQDDGLLTVDVGAGPHGTNLYGVLMGSDPAPVASVERGTVDMRPPHDPAGGGVSSDTRTVLDPPVIDPRAREGSGAKLTKAERDAWFRSFWNEYPRRNGGPRAAQVEFERILRGSPTPALLAAQIVDAARRYASDPNQPTDRTMIPHATTWLRDGRWEDDPLPEREDKPRPSAADRDL